MQRFIWSLAALALLGVGLRPARADELYTTFGPGDSYQNSGWPIGGSNSLFGGYSSYAMEFSPSKTATLDLVRFPAFAFGAGGAVDAVLAADNGGSPGAMLENLGSVTITSEAIYSLSSSLHPQLTFGSEYWLLLQPTDPNSGVAAAWNLSPAVNATLAFTNDPAHGSWFLASGSQGAFEIQGSAVATPEPASMTLFGIGAAGLLGYAWRRRRMAAV
jgi:hypothetical protein